MKTFLFHLFLFVPAFFLSHLHAESLLEKEKRKLIEYYGLQSDIFEDRWFVWGYFIDLDGDGKKDAISASADYVDRIGTHWLFHLNKNEMWIETSLEVDETVFYSSPEQLYRLKKKETFPQLAMIVLKHTSEKEGYEIIGDETSYASVNSIEKIHIETKKNELFRCVTSWNFESLDRIALEVCEGNNLAESPFALRCGDMFFPAVSVTNTLTITERQMLASAYREDVRLRLSAQMPTTAKMMFTDADNDGRTDAFITSDADAIETSFNWTLYLNKEDGWKKAEKEIKRGSGAIPYQVIANENEFYHVYEMDYRKGGALFPWVSIIRKGIVYDYGIPFLGMGFSDRLNAFHTGNQKRMYDFLNEGSVPLNGATPPSTILNLFTVDSAFQRLERLSAEEWGVMTLYNGALGIDRQTAPKHEGRFRSPWEFIPATGKWVLHQNVNKYTNTVVTNQAVAVQE